MMFLHNSYKNNIMLFLKSQHLGCVPIFVRHAKLPLKIFDKFLFFLFRQDNSSGTVYWRQSRWRCVPKYYGCTKWMDVGEQRYSLEINLFSKCILQFYCFLNIILQLIKKVSQEDSALIMIPNYEKALSSILRDIHIRRR